MTSPRTKKQALEWIREHLETGKLGAAGADGCLYQDSEGRHCAVGCLFTQEQHDWIQSHEGLNSMGITQLMGLAPEFSTSFSDLSLAEVQRIQNHHDRVAGHGSSGRAAGWNSFRLMIMDMIMLA